MGTGTILKQALQSQHSAEITPNPYNEVELDENEIEEALREAREKKHFEMKRKSYAQNIVAQKQWYEPTANELKIVLSTTVSKNGDPYIINEKNEEIINQLCYYFSKDSRFSGDPLKGILLVGKPGVGKTHLMNFFVKNPKASYIIPTCKIISEKYANKWASDEKSTIEYYSELKRAEFGHQWDQNYLGCCFGDLGAESDSNSYGNKRNVIEEIVFNRYEANIPSYYTHFTTNLNAKEMEVKYGERFRDRIKEMCNVFTLDGLSFRK